MVWKSLRARGPMLIGFGTFELQLAITVIRMSAIVTFSPQIGRLAEALFDFFPQLVDIGDGHFHQRLRGGFVGAVALEEKHAGISGVQRGIAEHQPFERRGVFLAAGGQERAFVLFEDVDHLRRAFTDDLAIIDQNGNLAARVDFQEFRRAVLTGHHVDFFELDGLVAFIKGDVDGHRACARRVVKCVHGEFLHGVGMVINRRFASATM